MAEDNTEMTKEDLYKHLGERLTNDQGMSLGRLDRVRAAYDFCEFVMPDGETIRRDKETVLTQINAGFSFETDD